MVNVMKSIPKKEVLGKPNEKSVALLFRLIESYYAWNKTDTTYSYISIKGVCDKAVLTDLRDGTINFVLDVFDATIVTQSDPHWNSFYVYFLNKYNKSFPWLALIKYKRNLKLIIKKNEKFFIGLQDNIGELSILLKCEIDEAKQMLARLDLNSRFPIQYYSLAHSSLMNNVLRYLTQRSVLEKFIYNAFLQELKLAKIPISEIRESFWFIIAEYFINEKKDTNAFSQVFWDKLEMFISEE